MASTTRADSSEERSLRTGSPTRGPSWSMVRFAIVTELTHSTAGRYIWTAGETPRRNQSYPGLPYTVGRGNWTFSGRPYKVPTHYGTLTRVKRRVEKQILTPIRNTCSPEILYIVMCSSRIPPLKVLKFGYQCVVWGSSLATFGYRPNRTWLPVVGTWLPCPR